MFWKIEGLDKNNKPSTVYIQGTFFVGDKKLFPLSQEVESAWKNSDRYAGEISSGDRAGIVKEVENICLESYSEAAGRTISSQLTENELDTLKSCIKDSAVFGLLDDLEPWCSLTFILNFPHIDSALKGEESLDGYLDDYFMLRADSEGKKVLGLDTLEAQLDIVKTGDYATQLLLLKDLLKNISEDSQSSVKAGLLSKKIYEAYLADDVENFKKLINEERKNNIGRSECYKVFYENVFDKRNEDWANDIENFLNEGGCTFVFAGAGNFLGKNSVFDILHKKGIL